MHVGCFQIRGRALPIASRTATARFVVQVEPVHQTVLGVGQRLFDIRAA